MATGAEPDHPPLSREEAAKTALALVALTRPRKLSEEMERLIHEFQSRSVTLRELIAVFQTRAYDLLMLLLALPFLVPIPLPGLSMALGMVIAIIAARLMLGQKPWLPRRLLDTSLPPRFFPLLLGSARRVVRALEYLLKPRLLWLTTPLLTQLHALIIFIAAFVLLLPLPPGTNFPPALVIVIMAGGLIERDGFFIVAGYLAFALNIVFFGAFGFYGTKLIDMAWHWITQ